MPALSNSFKIEKREMSGDREVFHRDHSLLNIIIELII